MVTVADLLAGVTVAEVRGDPSATEVGAVVYDSRRAVHGALFCCIPGARSDGHAFAAAAVAQGAGSLLCERFLDLAVPQVRVAPGAVRPAMAEVASTFWGHPDRSLTTVGVTGTNGKTTVTHLVRAILEAAGRPTGVIGTLSGVRTTPEAPDLQEALAGLVAGLHPDRARWKMAVRSPFARSARGVPEVWESRSRRKSWSISRAHSASSRSLPQASARARAMARPNPREDPVTSATRPCRPKDCSR